MPIWKKVLFGVLALAIVGFAVLIGRVTNKSSVDNTSAAASASASSASAVVAAAPPAPKKPDCPDGTLWDTKKEVCVQTAAPIQFPSEITANVKLPCPSDCPMAAASAAPVASAAPPKPRHYAAAGPEEVDLTTNGALPSFARVTTK